MSRCGCDPTLLADAALLDAALLAATLLADAALLDAALLAATLLADAALLDAALLAATLLADVALLATLLADAALLAATLPALAGVPSSSLLLLRRHVHPNRRNILRCLRDTFRTQIQRSPHLQASARWPASIRIYTA